jgi:hypothetical protein
MAEVEPGKWYLVVKCHYCGQGLALMADPNQKEEPAPMLFERERARIRCPVCDATDEYSLSEVRRAAGPTPSSVH